MRPMLRTRVGRRTAARPRRERGAVAVEFALVVPILVMMLLGVTTIALGYNDHLAVQNAAREGARLGSAIDYSTAPGTWADSVQTRVQQVYFNSGSTVTTSQICVRLYRFDATGTGTMLAQTASASGTGCGTEPASPTSPGDGSCAVKVWVGKTGQVNLGVLPSIPYNISAKAVDYYGRSAGTCTAL